MPDYHCAFCFIKEIINTGTGNQNIRSEILKKNSVENTGYHIQIFYHGSQLSRFS